MLRIPCPFCGLRSHDEFSYEGEAGVDWPDLSETDAERWHAAVFLRRNPAGPHRELWQHAAGCRLWLVVERDTVTHTIRSVAAAHPDVARMLAAEESGRPDSGGGGDK